MKEQQPVDTQAIYALSRLLEPVNNFNIAGGGNTTYLLNQENRNIVEKKLMELINRL
jgi:hypothetical protein